MELYIPYAIGLISLGIAVYGVFKSAIDKAEIRLVLTADMLYDCRDELEEAKKTILNLQNELRQAKEANHSPAVNVTNISGEAKVKTGKDVVSGTKKLRDEMQAGNDVTHETRDETQKRDD